MATVAEKQRAIKALHALSDCATVADTIERLCVVAKIEEGLRQSEAGQVTPQGQEAIRAVRSVADKTITIDVEAYERLARHKRPGQSFSEVIKEHFKPSFTGRDLLKLLDRVRLEPETLDAIDAVIESRRRDPARAPKL